MNHLINRYPKREIWRQLYFLWGPKPLPKIRPKILEKPRPNKSEKQELPFWNPFF